MPDGFTIIRAGRSVSGRIRTRSSFNARGPTATDDGSMKAVGPDDLVIPDSWDIVAGADTGTYMSGLIGAIPPEDEPPLYILEEFPNYHYVSGTIELLGLTVREWIADFSARLRHYHGEGPVCAWVDRNTTFTSEIGDGLAFERNSIHLELRTEITREYFQHNRIWLAPWLRVLPYELEHASWPDSPTRAGRYTRKKEKDHTLDCLEHICSRRPISTHQTGNAPVRFLDQYLQQHGTRPQGPQDAHLGEL